MGEEIVKEINGVVIVVIIVGFIFLMMATIAYISSAFGDSMKPGDSSQSFSQSILSDNGTATILTPSGEGITTHSATYKNQSWLEFDGNNDRVLVNTNTITSLSFWYKNATTDWQHIVNSSGTIYVNGTVGTALLYPIYDDGTDIYIGKSDAATFVDVDIDDVRTYGTILNSSDVTTLFDNGR